MTDIQLKSCCDKLRAIPKTSSRLHGGQVSKGSDDKCYPATYLVPKLKLIHAIMLLY